MKRLVRSMKRSLSFLLAAAMIFTMMPQTGMTAEASEYQAESVLRGGKTVRETDLAANVDSVNNEAGTGEKAVSYSETDPEGGSQDDGGTNPVGETGSGAGDETDGETNPGTGDETDGETNPGVDDEAGGETIPGEGDGTGGETNPGTGNETGDGTGSGTTPGTGDESDDETNPGTGDEQGGETDPGEGEETGGETNPDEEEETDGETDPGEEDETDEETDPDEEEESDELDGKLTASGSARSGVEDFTIDANGTLTAYNGAGGDVTIPDTVTAIGNNVFKGKTDITSVTIPDTVLSIGEEAFSGCTALAEVNLNEGLATIGKGAFYGVPFGRKELSGAIIGGNLTIPGSVTSIGAAAFQNSECLEQVIFENGPEELKMSSNYAAFDGERGAFRDCKALKKVTLPDQLKTLPQHTFYGCIALKEVGLNDGLETIGNQAFRNCTSLLAAVMPDSLRSIGEDAFSACSVLETVHLNAGLETIGKGAFYGVPFGRKELSGAIISEPLTIPGSVTSIGAAAFQNSECLEQVIFENGPEELKMSSNYAAFDGERGAFRDCKALKQVTLPDQLKTLPQHTFYGCTALKEVGLNDGLETIGNQAFRNCTSLLAAVMPDSLRSIGEDAFSDCSVLETVHLNAGLETIGKGAFYGVPFGRKELSGAIISEPLTIPGSVTSIGAAAFQNSECLEQVIFENGPAELTMSSNYAAFDGERGAFRDCKALKQVTLPDQLKTLPQHTFYGCTALEEVSLDAGLETIGNQAFKNCTSLLAAVMPDSLKSIGEDAFSDCSVLETVHLNAGLETISKGAFYGVPFGRKELSGAIISEPLTIPGSVTSIGAAAFQNSECLEQVIFENGPTELTMSSNYAAFDGERGAFRDCKALKQVTLPDQLKTLPQHTFYGCTALEELEFGIYLETIGNQAFRNCSSLLAAVMPDSLKSIGDDAFSGCSALEEVSLNAGLETIARGAFDGVPFGRKELSGVITGGTLTIPRSVTSIGAAAFQNSACLESVVFEQGTSELTMSSNYAAFDGEKGAFRNCKALKQVTLPDQLKKLPQNTFEGCSALEEVEFGKYLTSIGKRTFANCSSLQRVYLPESSTQESLTSIDAEAFADCGALEILYIPGTVTSIGKDILKNCPKVVIYGVRGSEAENYANKNNIPFREEGELESIRFVTGISLNRSKITVAGEDALDSVFALTATVRPGTAQDKRVDFTSNDEAVAHVDAQGKVTIKGYGTAKITATARDNKYGTKTAVCTVTVLRRLSEAEKEAILRQLQEANADKLTVVTNICETVKDISLDCPAGLESAEWRLPYSISTGVETYDVIVEKDGYEKAVISGIEITGITVEGISVSGANKLQNGKDTNLSVEIQMAGGELSEDDYEIKWETTANSGVSLTNPEQNPVTVRGNANKTATVTGYLLLKKDGKPADRKNNALKNKQWFSASTKITVTGDAVADRIEIEAADRNGQKAELASLRELSNITEPVEYQLSAKVYSGEDPLSNPVLQWKSTNPSVAEVKAQGDRATLRVKEKGAAVISVSASKNGGFTESFRVVVKDSTPRLEETGITLNLNQIQPSTVVHISPSDGYAIAEESLAVVKENGSEADFTISRVSNKETEYQIGIKDGKTLSGKHKVFLQMKTSAGEQQAHRLPLTITISKQLPKVTVAQESVFNLYEKGAEAKITVKTDTAIAEIEYIPSAASGPKLVLKESNPTEGYFTVTAEGQTSGNYKKTSVKGKLRITFAGYQANATYDKAFTIKVNKNLPAVLAVPVNTVLYPETPEYQETELNKTAISFLLKADRQDITAEAGWHMEPSGNPPTGVTVEPNSEGQPITVTFANTAKNSATLKFVVRNDNWIDQTGVKASCTIKKGTTPEIDFSNNKPILNTEYGLDEYEPVEIALCVKNHPERRIARILSVEGKDAKAKEVQEDGFSFVFERNKSTLQVGIRSKDLFTAKNAKYTYLVKGMDERGIPVSGNLTVTVTKTPAKATVKQSGSIDLLNREGTQILCKPTIKNYTDTIESVYLYGSYASSFCAKCEDGNIVIKARENKPLKVKTTYKLFLRIRLASGVVLDSEVKVTPKQNNPKLSLNLQKTVLFEASPGEPFGKSIVVTPTKEGGPEISGIELTNGGDTFGYTDEGDGYGTLYVLDTASQKVNKTYKLKLAVRFKDGAVNAAPVYVTVSVNYKK